MSIKSFLSRTYRYLVKGMPVNIITANIVELAPNQLLANKTALVTGGTSGIGFEIAKSFLKAGANVIITGRNFGRIENA